ncbi:MAG TPA: cytochrome c [Methylocella sp.]
MVGVSYAKDLTYTLPEESSTLRPESGVERAQNNCVTCHSVDYINTQPPNRGKAFWVAEITKMIKVYHAPINDADAMAIADYLAKTY